MSEILPKLDFGHFHREVCGHSHLNVPRIQKRFCFVPEPCLVGQWRSQTQIFLGEMYDFRRTATALFCLEKSLSKHKMTVFQNFWGAWPLCPPLATPMISSVATPECQRRERPNF